MTGVAVSVEGLSLRASRRLLVDDLWLRVEPGETVGIVGESGSGKSLTARALLGLLPPGISASGSVRVGTCDVLAAGERERRALRGTTIALMLQDPYTMLNPLMRIGEEITQSLRHEGKRPRGAARSAEAARRLSEVGIADPRVVSQYPFELSGGMRQRAALAATLASDPDVLVADEPSTALDVTTQREILRLLRSVQQARGMSVILITHDLGVAFAMCDRVYVLYAGRLMEAGDSSQIARAPLHPYSLGLLLSDPPLDRRVRMPTMREATARDGDGEACAFAARCEWAANACRTTRPRVTAHGSRQTACLRVEELAPMLAARRESVEHAAVERPAPASQPYLSATSLMKTFPSRGGATTTALGDASIEIGAGESVGVVGESGSGKTTLARCLVGLETPDSGRIALGGEELPRRRDHALRARLATQIQFVFQDPYSSLNPMKTVRSTLAEALEVTEGSTSYTVSDLLELVRLPAAYAARKPFALSGGERQRVAIARALAPNPRLIVCDEPVSALDVSVQAQILNLFVSLRDELGLAYLFITHDLAVARQVVDRIYVMHRGRIVESGAAADVLDAPKDAYTRTLLASVPRADRNWLLR